MIQRFVICEHGLWDASLIPEGLLASPGACPSGVYDTWLVNDGRVQDWEAHWSRLAEGASYLNIDRNFEDLLAPAEVVELNQVNGLSNGIARLRVQVFEEPQATDSGSIRFLAAVFPVSQALDSDFKVQLGERKRRAGEKRFNYKLLANRDSEVELEKARRLGFSDVIFLNHLDEVCEAVYANVWLLKNNRLRTPPLTSPCLPGVTRHKVFAAAHALGLRAMEDEPVFLADLLTADEVFLTSTIRGVQPVVQIGDQKIDAKGKGDSNIAALLARSLYRP